MKILNLSYDWEITYKSNYEIQYPHVNQKNTVAVLANKSQEIEILKVLLKLKEYSKYCKYCDYKIMCQLSHGILICESWINLEVH